MKTRAMFVPPGQKCIRPSTAVPPGLMSIQFLKMTIGPFILRMQAHVMSEDPSVSINQPMEEIPGPLYIIILLGS